MKAAQSTFIVFLFLVPIIVSSSLVKAASTGEDFEWLATTDNGVRIGLSGQVGELPAGRTLEFFGCGTILFGDDGAISFSQDGNIMADTTMSVLAYDANAAMGGAFLASTEAEGEEVGASVVGVGGGAALVSAAGEVPASSVVCTYDGCVVVTLGSSSSSSSSAKSQTPQKAIPAVKTEPAADFMGAFKRALDRYYDEQ